MTGHHHRPIGHHRGCHGCGPCHVCQSDQAAWALGATVLAPFAVLGAVLMWLARRPQFLLGILGVALVVLAVAGVVTRGHLAGDDLMGHVAAAGVMGLAGRLWHAARTRSRS
jgi:hypothetical protein